MTIEFSLRRRASQARCLAALYLSLAIAVLIGGYLALPSIAFETLRAVNQIDGPMHVADGSTATANNASFIHVHIFALVVLIQCLVVIAFAGYLLARTALIEIELAARFTGLADALCIAGDNFDKLQKAVELLVPKRKYAPELSEKNLKAISEIVKNARG